MQIENKTIACLRAISGRTARSRLLFKMLLLSILLSVSHTANAQLSDSERQKTAALVVIIDYILSDDIERIEQSALIPAASSIDVYIGSTANNAVNGGDGSGSLVFSSLNPSIASVDSSSGEINALAIGSTDISVFKRGNRFFLNSAPIQFTVNVLERLIQPALEFDTPELDIDINASGSNPVSGGAGTGALSYTSSNELIATVNPTTGLVTGVAAGNAMITVDKAGDSTYQDATSISYSVTVNKLAQQALSFQLAQLSIEVGSSTSNLASGGNGVGAISYSSSAPLVASVNQMTGEVTALAEGSASITAKRAGDDVYLESSDVSYTVTVNAVISTGCVWDNDNWNECDWQ